MQKRNPPLDYGNSLNGSNGFITKVEDNSDERTYTDEVTITSRAASPQPVENVEMMEDELDTAVLDNGIGTDQKMEDGFESQVKDV
jgi:hypothetical protein